MPTSRHCASKAGDLLCKHVDKKIKSVSASALAQAPRKKSRRRKKSAK